MELNEERTLSAVAKELFQKKWKLDLLFKNESTNLLVVIFLNLDTDAFFSKNMKIYIHVRNS